MNRISQWLRTMNLKPNASTTERYTVLNSALLIGLRFGDAIELDEARGVQVKLQLRITSKAGVTREVFLEPMPLLVVRELTLGALSNPLEGMDAIHEGEALEVVLTNTSAWHIEARPFAMYAVRGERRLAIEA